MDKKMTKQSFSMFLVLNLFTMLVILVGCATTEPSRYYILQSMKAEAARTQAGVVKRDLAIGVGPVELSKHLDRPQIVIRAEGNVVSFAEFDRWAEPLKENISRVLSENLSILLSTNRVAVFPWKISTLIDYRVEVSLLRFDVSPEGNTTLIANWTISDGKGTQVLLQRRSVIRSSATGQSYKAKVLAMNRTLSDLSQEIASDIKGLPN